MNKEQLICRAGLAIADFNRLHCGTCYLNHENGKIFAYPLKSAITKPNPCLIISESQQVDGLTSKKWSSIGNALMLQLVKETSK